MYIKKKSPKHTHTQNERERKKKVKQHIPTQVIAIIKGISALRSNQELTLGAKFQPLPLQIIHQQHSHVSQALLLRPRRRSLTPVILHSRTPQTLGFVGKPVNQARRVNGRGRICINGEHHHQNGTEKAGFFHGELSENRRGNAGGKSLFK